MKSSEKHSKLNKLANNLEKLTFRKKYRVSNICNQIVISIYMRVLWIILKVLVWEYQSENIFLKIRSSGRTGLKFLALENVAPMFNILQIIIK